MTSKPYNKPASRQGSSGHGQVIAPARDAACTDMKKCAKCGCEKELNHFHAHKGGSQGRHSWCKDCCNAYYRVNRKRNYSPEQKRRWQLSTRYGITPQDVDAMRIGQGGRCAICDKPTDALVVDHCHKSGNVRGLLCHPCNILLPGLERKEWMNRAIQYLKSNEVR